MQQRRPRLGDILDDYCPRERRITNHAIVAMIEDEVKQTRCTTCDSDHEYRQARTPPPRRKKETLTPSIPTDMADQETQDQELVEDTPFVPDAAAEAAPVEAQAEPVEAAASEDTGETGDEQREDDGPVHRRLIRATLPRSEGQTPERKAPEFTVRQPGGQGNQRPDRGRRAARGPQGPSSFSGPMRFGSGSRQNSPQGQQRQNGNRPGPSGNQRGGGRPQGQQRGSGRKRGR